MLRSHFASHLSAALLAMFVGANSLQADSAPTDSPFLPSPNAAPAGAAANTAYTLAGMTVVGKDTLVGVTRSSDKRSFWIPVGKTTGEITVVSYDAKNDQAVIRANGKLETLTMKKSAVIPGGPAITPVAQTAKPAAAAPQPPVDVPTAPMSAQEEKEMEARMLVTDLLEIGQRQRKAYEEAQRQAAARNAGKPAAPAPQPAKQ